MRASAAALRQLLLAARSGSSSALGQALEEYRDLLLHLARDLLDSKLRQKAGASDLVQETFLRAQRHFHRFHGEAESEWIRWLRRILVNLMRNLVRDQRSTTKRQCDRELSLPEAPRMDGAMHGHRDCPSPSSLYRKVEAGEKLRQAIAQLSGDHRRVVQMRYEQHLSFEEIGQHLGRSPDAARLLWYRALGRLKSIMRQLP